MAKIFHLRSFKSGGYGETAEPGSINPHDDPWYRIELDDSVGHGDIVIIKTKYGFWETHAGIPMFLCGKGWGIRLYSEAIRLALRKGLAVKSSRHYNDMAERVWKSRRLRRLFKIRKIKNRYCVLGRNK